MVSQGLASTWQCESKIQVFVKNEKGPSNSYISHASFVISLNDRGSFEQLGEWELVTHSSSTSFASLLRFFARQCGSKSTFLCGYIAFGNTIAFGGDHDRSISTDNAVNLLRYMYTKKEEKKDIFGKKEEDSSLRAYLNLHTGELNAFMGGKTSMTENGLCKQIPLAPKDESQVPPDKSVKPKPTDRK